MVFTLVFKDADADSRYACSVQRRGVGWATAVDMFPLVYDAKSEEYAFFAGGTLDKYIWLSLNKCSRPTP